MYKELFLVSECSSGGLNGSPVEVKEGFPPQMQLGWMLFLALRMHVLNQFPDLVTCTNGLLAIIVCRHSLLMYFLHIGLFDGTHVAMLLVSLCQKWNSSCLVRMCLPDLAISQHGALL